MAAKSTKILFTIFLTVNFLPVKAEQTRLEEFRVGLESENDTSLLNKTLNKLSTAEENIDDNVFSCVYKSVGNLTCLSCQPPNCDHPTLCHNAISCFTAHTRETDGFINRLKGNPQDHITCTPLSEGV